MAAARIEIDPNVRIGKNLTYAGFEDITGARPSDLPRGTEVAVFESESGLHGTAEVAGRDIWRHLIYLKVDWRSLRLPPDTPEMAAYQKASNELHELTGD